MNKVAGLLRRKNSAAVVRSRETDGLRRGFNNLECSAEKRVGFRCRRWLTTRSYNRFIVERLTATLGSIALVTLIACQTVVVSRLTEEQANQVVVALNAASIAAKKVPESSSDRTPLFKVEVSSGKAARALSVLQAAELPKRPAPGWDEAFSKTSIIPTPIEERARFIAALSGEISRSIEAMPGIVDARVHIALADNRATPLEAMPVRPRASVVVKTKRKEGENNAGVTQKAIQKLVAGAVQDMKPDDVTVIEIKLPSPMRQTPELVEIGPITIARESAGALKVTAGALLFVLVILATTVIVLITRLRRTPEKVK
ncbi:MAG: hypothetical protein JXA30_08595 [Deltaproteobacteria bacterium]|nr:hypothetical protein [Deltaproteobacteria bacterium]